MSMWALNHWRWFVGVAVGLLLFGAGRLLGAPLLANPVQSAVVVELPCPDPPEGTSPPAASSSQGSQEAGSQGDSPTGAPASEEPAPDEPITPSLININTASVEALQTLPGIGPVLAQRIVDYREQWGPFQHVVDLMEVSGIGPRLLQRLEPHVTVDP